MRGSKLNIPIKKLQIITIILKSILLNIVVNIGLLELFKKVHVSNKELF